MDFWANLGSGSHSPVLYAVPAFLVLIAVELLSYRRDEREARPAVAAATSGATAGRASCPASARSSSAPRGRP